MKKSAKFALQFLVIGLVLAYPQDAVAGKKSNNFLTNVGRALGGDTEALKKVVGSDVAHALAALGGDDAARAKLKLDWENAKKKFDALVVKLELLMADEEEVVAKAASSTPSKAVEDSKEEEKPATMAGAGAAAPTEEVTPDALAGLNTRLAALEAQFAEEMARRAGLRAALPVPVTSAAAGAGVAADDKELSPKATVGAAAPTEELLAVQAAQLASLQHPAAAAGTGDDPAEPSSIVAPTPRVSGAALPPLTEDKAP